MSWQLNTLRFDAKSVLYLRRKWHIKFSLIVLAADPGKQLETAAVYGETTPEHASLQQ
jgi:hypothetical protein